MAATLAVIVTGCNKKSNEPINNNSKAVGTVTDVCGNTYNYVKIGSQYWLAENMRCNKYDTESERANETIAIPSKNDEYYYDNPFDASNPFYFDASDKSSWRGYAYADNLTDTQVKLLGFLYTWSAAVGYASKEEAKKHEGGFGGKRQGICPNGWHVPEISEYEKLAEEIGDKKDKYGDYSKSGVLLKTTSGWHEKAGCGTDEYGFSVLPAGFANSSSTCLPGGSSYIWTATDPYVNDAYHVAFFDDLNEMEVHVTSYKSDAFSVRCVKN